MKQTVADLFSPEDDYAYFILAWGSRAETPHELAARQWATMKALDGVVPADDPRYPAPKWVDPNDDLYSRHRPPTPNSLGGLQEQVTHKAQVHEDGTVQGGVPLAAFLTPDGGNGTLASIEGVVGHRKTSTGNDVMIRFLPGFPIGDAQDAAELFRKLVRIWQPDWASMDTLRTSREIQGLEKTYADYLTWLSRSMFATPPELESVTEEAFGDGTLLTVKEWSIDGVRAMYKELQAADVPAAIVANPLKPQVVPQFPAASA